MRKPRRLTAKVSTSIRFTVEQEEAVRLEAQRRGVSITALIGEIVDEWMLFRKPSAHAVNAEVRRGQ